ncbi:MAG: paraquat-inducible protein A [Pseudomonadota bacterium]
MDEPSDLPRAALGSERADAHGPGGAAARGLLIIVLFVLPMGLLLPMLETTRLVVFKDTYSLMDAIVTLLGRGEILLGGVILVFSVLFPSIKALALWLIHVFPPEREGPFVRLIETLGKWSMMDVLIAALIVFALSGAGVSGAASLPGLYLFTLAAIGLMLASGLISRDLRRAEVRVSASNGDEQV